MGSNLEDGGEGVDGSVWRRAALLGLLRRAAAEGCGLEEAAPAVLSLFQKPPLVLYDRPIAGWLGLQPLRPFRSFGLAEDFALPEVLDEAAAAFTAFKLPGGAGVIISVL
jgi:hypothetical protein